MTTGRLVAYKSARRSVADAPLSDGERERLRDIAEALLLTRATAAEDAESLRRDAALALSLLAGQGRLDDKFADRLWLEISKCGPAGATRDRQRVAASL